MADLEFEKMVVEMLALMSTTEGVVGLRMDGGTMPWAEVVKLYLPSWRSAQFDGTEIGTWTEQFDSGDADG